MDDPRDPLLVEDAAERVEVGDVAAHELDGRTLVGREDELEAMHRLAEVVGHRLVAGREHGLQRPRADAPERAGDEDALHQ